MEAITVGPNPAHTNVMLQMRHPLGEGAVVRLVDGMGRTILRLPAEAGEDHIILQLDEFAPGPYWAVVESGGVLSIGRFVIVR